MREQTVTPRGGRERAAGGRGRAAGDILNVQQPAPRRGAPSRGKAGAGKAASASRGGAWRSARAWLPATLKIALAVCAGLLLFRGYRAAASSDFFELRSVDVTGTARASDDQIKQIVRQAAAGRGVWKVDLDAVRSEIEGQPWVRAAVVSRVLPSGLRVRVTERVPRVVVRTNAGRFVWVDDDAVTVGALAPQHQQPNFFLRGWDESGAPAAVAANRERVAKFLELAREWEAAGLSARVSEVNLDDLRDVRAQLAGDDSQIEVRLGGADWTKRLIHALEGLDELRQSQRGARVTYVDMTARRVFGFDSQAAAREAAAASQAASLTGEPGAKKADAASRPAAEGARKGAEKKADAKRRAAGEAAGRDGARDGSERPRRVGGDTERE